MSDDRWTRDPVIDAYLANMKLPPKPFMDRLEAERAVHEAAAPKMGDAAPPFTARLLSPEGLPGDESISLSDFRGRNLALVFGSYTCPIYRGQIERLNEIHADLRDRLAFLLIYISEAHPEDGWKVDINHTQDVVYDQPTATGERAAVAAVCVARHDIRMPIALDDMDDSINHAYSASPERLYLVDGEGIVRHRSPPGPFKLSVVEAWYAALR
ncbi:MAG: deiodinase-like protein [Gammaproteobacteria bacterium]